MIIPERMKMGIEVYCCEAHILYLKYVILKGKCDKLKMDCKPQILGLRQKLKTFFKRGIAGKPKEEIKQNTKNTQLIQTYRINSKDIGRWHTRNQQY